MTNNYDSSVTINTSEASLEFGGVKVAPKNRDEIRISSDVRSQMVYIFDFGKGKPEEGPADLTITPYSNADVALAPIKIHLDIKYLRVSIWTAYLSLIPTRTVQ